MKKYAVRPIKGTTLLDHLLFHRGITSPELAEKFLNPDYEKHTLNPFLLADVEKAAERIIKAIKNNERIVVYSDYDADGIPGGVIFHDFFKATNFGNFENYIPHRHDEGFGLNMQAIKACAEAGGKLLITIDCGINNIAEVAYANTLGFDVIITDHHLPKEILPSAYAVINPKRLDCQYPEKMLCGAGVAFKLIQAILLKERFNIAIGWEKWLLDMVGLATLSDMVPLLGENRVFAYYGLMVLRKSRRIGLIKLLEKLRISQRHLAEDDISFMITPRINAASRMGEPGDAFRLFATDNLLEADRLSEHLNQINDERKGVVASMVKEMRRTIESRYDGREKKVIVLGNPNWRPSLLGLVAGNLAEEHSCPVFLWGRDGSSNLKGSCRSGGSVSVITLMASVGQEILTDYGGHELSGGFTLMTEKAHLLESALEQSYETNSQERVESNQTLVDRAMSFEEVTEENYKLINRLSPFGVGNPKPVFLFADGEISRLRWFGKDRRHLELIFRKQSGESVSSVKFFAKDEADFERLLSGNKINLTASIEKSHFNGRSDLRLRIVDVFV